jgi:aminopeptidase N
MGLRSGWRNRSSSFPGLARRSSSITLRLRIGDEASFNTLKTFRARFKYSHASTSDFTAVAEEVSGEDLRSFFKEWLNTKDPQLPK